jgi:1,2-dihydroxy-3-keto-5-methylthiopentene dioxygenase
MAVVTIAATGEKIREDAAVRVLLARWGVEFERWEIRAGDPIEAYRSERERLAREKGYVDADVVRLSSETPNLEALLAKFDKDHFHTDDEVRFISDGEGIFGLSTAAGEKLEILVGAGDFISIPANVFHWFTLTPLRRITALRLFKDKGGWVPYYRGAAPSGTGTPADTGAPK